MMITIKTDNIESTNSERQDLEGTQAVMATLGGTVVEELDNLLGSYNAELISVNHEIASVRADKDAFSSFVGSEKTEFVDFDGVLKEGILVDEFSPELKEILEKFNIDYENIGNNEFISLESIEALKDSADSKIQSLNSQTELKMINFQALMDSRKQAMLMLSNMISSDNSTKQAIIQNMKG